jgi:hypothetical protein
MKSTTLNTIGQFSLVLLFACETTVASAGDISPQHFVEGTLSLGNAATATDVFRVTCSTVNSNGSVPGGDTPHHLIAAVRDDNVAATPRVRVQAIKIANAGPASIDTTNALASAVIDTTNPAGAEAAEIGYSNDTKANPAPSSGVGDYFILVSKSTTGVENYSLKYHCENSSNNEVLGTFPDEITLPLAGSHHILDQ